MAMEYYSSKLFALLLISMLFISSSISPILACGHCHPAKGKTHHPKTRPPKTRPPKDPITVVPPFIGKPPITLPPILPPGTDKPNCPPTPTSPTCPIDSLKLGACVDLLRGLAHVVIGDPVVNECCPILEGLLELEAAVCLCTTIKLKLLDINIYLPLALQLLVTCGMAPPPGHICTV